jgi:hypothetical protein
MKTSNKLLIAFAAALILIPVLGMVIVSATQYRKGSYADRVDVVPKIESFKQATANMTSITLPSAFESVHIEDAKGLDINIRLIKDEQFGVKIAEEYKDLVSASLDANGELQLNVKELKNEGQNRARDYALIYVYAPNLNSLTVANASGLIVKPVIDSLNVKLNKVESFYFDNDTKLRQLDIEAVEVKDLKLRRDKIKSANVVVTDTKFAIESMSLDNVSITTNGKSKVDVYNNERNKTSHSIKNLVLITNGIADVKFENITVNNCAGKLSDQTQVQMPAVNLNQMYNAKK